MNSRPPRIALISATPVAMPPATDGLAAEFPEAEAWHLLDDRLLGDASDSDGLTPSLEERMRHLIDHAIAGGADGVLLTCSLYGPVAQGMAHAVPTLAPDEAAFAEAAGGDYHSILVVASFESAMRDSVERLTQTVASSRRSVTVVGATAAAAFEAAQQGVRERLVEALLATCRAEPADYDAVLLAQYSLAPAREELAVALGKPVIAGPQSAAAVLRSMIRAPRAVRGLGAIADDYTGGTDLAVALRRAGLRTLIFFGTPDTSLDLPPHDSVVVALKTRTIDPEKAVSMSLEARDWLVGAGAERLYYKYCSTFDSTPDGNIGPVVDALAETGGAATVVTTPSSPEHRRTVFHGHLFVDGMPLAESPMAQHPLTPMTDSSVPRLLTAQTGHSVAPLPLATVRAGPGAVREALGQARRDGVRHLVADATDDADLRTIAEAVADEPLTAGAAGLGSALAEVLAERGAAPEDLMPEDPVGTGPAIILAGSCSARTLEQLRALETQGRPSYRLDALAVPSAEQLAERALAWFDSLPSGPTPAVYSSLPADELAAVQRELGTQEAADLLETAMGLVAQGMASRGVRRFIVAGGETSGAVVDALGVAGGIIGPEAAPGVPWVYGLGSDPLALLLKSGNFGDVDLLLRTSEDSAAWGVRP